MLCLLVGCWWWVCCVGSIPRYSSLMRCVDMRYCDAELNMKILKMFSLSDVCLFLVVSGRVGM